MCVCAPTQASLQRWFLDLLSGFLSVSGVRYDGSDLLREALRSRTGAATDTPNSTPRAPGDTLTSTDEVSVCAHARAPACVCVYVCMF